MNIKLLENVNELTAAEQKSLYTAGADIYTSQYYVVADISDFKYSGKDLKPNRPVLNSISLKNDIKWIETTFRGQVVAFGSATF